MDFRANAVYQDHQGPWGHLVRTVTRVNRANRVKRDLKEAKEIS